MIQAAGRFAAGFSVGTVITLALFFIPRSCFLTTTQTSQSEPHYEVRYAGLTPDTILAVVFLLPVVSGLLSAAILKRTLTRRILATSAVLAVLAGCGLIHTFNTILGDALWRRMG